MPRDGFPLDLSQEAAAEVPLRSADYKVDLEGATHFMPGLLYALIPSIPLALDTDKQHARNSR